LNSFKLFTIQFIIHIIIIKMPVFLIIIITVAPMKKLILYKFIHGADVGEMSISFYND